MIRIICPKKDCGAENWVYCGYKTSTKGEPRVQRFLCKTCNKEFTDINILSQFPDADITLLRENIRLAKSKQYFRDKSRIQRRAFTDYARLDNATSEYSQELIKLFKGYDLSRFTIEHNQYNDSAMGIIHFTDAHFNELVNLEINKYDFTIASKRCKLLVDEAKLYFKQKGIHSVLFAITGDLLNSDRRLDELLAQATNRSKATFLAVRLIELMLLDLNSDFDVTVANVTGNESRVHKDVAWNDIVATDNYDFTIYNILTYIFKGAKGIQFIENADPLELVINIGSKNILLIHGHQWKGKIDAAIQRLRGKYAARGVIIHFVLFGHLHGALIADTFARGGSIVGANEYSDKGLGYISRASQNIHIIYNTDRIDSIKIDLQDVEYIKGYDIREELRVYEVKDSIVGLDYNKAKSEIVSIVAKGGDDNAKI